MVGADEAKEVDEIDLSRQIDAVERLDVERKAVGMSIYDMETKSGVSINSFYAWKRNDRCATMGNFVALAQALGFDVIMRKRQP